MAQNPQPLPRSLWVGMGVIFGLLGLVYLLSFAELSHQHKIPLPVINRVADFTLTNQDDQTVTLNDLTNHVWLADIIFTRCAGPCPEMTMHMKQLQDALPKNSHAKLVTLTTDPDYDSPKILKRYGEHYDADFNRWMFLTGTKRQIGALGTDSLKLGSTPIASTNRLSAVDLFIHTTIFVLVDKHAQLRGIFETAGADVNWPQQQKKILRAIRQLENEP